MTSDRWRQVEDLCHAALARAPADRAAFLATACAGDDVLRRDVESLLAQEPDAAAFMSVPAVVGASAVLDHANGDLVGRRLGAYEVLAPLGAGGMGEVYRAQDSRLDRIVAIKVLPAHVAADPERKQRFEREAKTLAALSHPHICPVFDMGQQDGIDFLVMEYLEGQTLASRLEKGALPLDQALQCAIQIADALDNAHRKRIIHRDLKPGNVMLTRAGAKLLDFGLAKLRPGAGLPASDGGPVAVSGVPARSAPVGDVDPARLTAQGTILGTVQYMAPEQLEGQEADARTDIFAFGAVLYEMITGKKAFEGKSQASLIGAILRDTPSSITAAQPLTPPPLERIVTTCLAKDPDDRWQNAHDLLRELKWIAEAGTGLTVASPLVVAPKRGFRSLGVAWFAAGCVLMTLMLGALSSIWRTSVDSGTYRVSIIPPANATLMYASNNVGSFLALAPDGRRLAFIAEGPDGRTMLWVRPLDGLTAQPLAGTEDATAPIWSPDSRFIAFKTQREIKKIDASGGPSLKVCDLPDGETGMSVGDWNGDGVILFGSGGGGPGRIYRVSAAGGTAFPIITPDLGSGEGVYSGPRFLPDGQHFLYNQTGAAKSPNGIYVASLDSKDRKLLLPDSFSPRYGQGFILFLRGQTILAQPLDVGRLQLSGSAVPLAEQVAVGGGTGIGVALSVSENGMLAYWTGPREAQSQLVWFDRLGRQTSRLGDPGDLTDPEISPDSKRVAVSVTDTAARTGDVWLYDIGRGFPSRFTFDPADEWSPIWSPDGRVAFGGGAWTFPKLYEKTSGGAGTNVLWEGGSPMSWSPDGRFVLYAKGTTPQTNDLWVLPLFGDRKPFPLVQAPFANLAARFSPDGRWVAYSSDESGRFQVYVVPFPGPGGKWQISTAGGQYPRWARDGKEIFFLAPDNNLIAATVDGRGPGFEVGAVRPLFQTHPKLSSDRFSSGPYDVSFDGRFLVNTLVGQVNTRPFTLVVNWTAALKN